MYGCGEQEAGVASRSGWNLWVWLLGVVVRRYIDFLILLIPTPLVSVLFAAASLLFVLPYSSCICSFCSSIPTFCSSLLLLYLFFLQQHPYFFVLFFILCFINTTAYTCIC